ncbi:MutS-related protein [Ruminococcus flavefaciens]|uniref:MutS-like protein n=1 Tax=Ruminococcus flavefaciens TaxID=1265 RepID=A0A315Y5Y5_RUMFL|nr:DNA mismatch repair protein [Ruminococcus flavefaciens]PWJ15383.1 MutS-like protein [Ruminococcus flavefaciens]SSA40514.1 MutS domain V [Ruminococcus flavefaciens]
MKDNNSFSILSPLDRDNVYRQLSATACHDLGLETLCRELTNDPKERNIITAILSNMTADQKTARYRQEVFRDVLALPELRTKMTELFDKIEFIRNFGSTRIDNDEKIGLWHLLHRLDELKDYILCVESMRECLSDERITSEGLTGFKKYLDSLYDDACFAEMKKDIFELKQKTSDIRSVTIGINVNERFEAVSMGLISINDTTFKKSNIISNFADAISSKDKIQKGCDWNGNMHYQLIEKEKTESVMKFMENLSGFMTIRDKPFMDAGIRSTIVNAANGDGVQNSTFYLDKILNKILDSLVKKLRNTLSKYADIAIINITQLIPEFMYYIRFAEFVSKYREKGYSFCEPQVLDSDRNDMDAQGLYNLKLALNSMPMEDIVCNDLIFDKAHTIYILTGANRGGKTTLTQAVGLMYVLAQGGISVPASSFSYKPVDCIYTHFPADEDKTMDLGRLGEECVRFKEIYTECTSDSLLLLNETFSTTSFEEGYYIARDSVRALMKKDVRTIFNTHMHKLASDADEMNKDGNSSMVSSLIMRSDEGKRSFKVEIALPEGSSYARDIAEKYGVTYKMLTNEQ